MRKRSIFVWFESDVISDGTQIVTGQGDTKSEFESDVISDGTQIDVIVSDWSI